MTLDVAHSLEAIRGQDKWRELCSCWGCSTTQASLKPWMEWCCPARPPGPGGGRHPLQQARDGPLTHSCNARYTPPFLKSLHEAPCWECHSHTIFARLMGSISVRAVFGCVWLDLMNGSFLLSSFLPFLSSLLFFLLLSHLSPLPFPLLLFSHNKELKDEQSRICSAAPRSKGF